MSEKQFVAYSFEGGSDLFNAMNTVRVIQEQDALESQLRTISLAQRMLKDIGVTLKDDTVE